MITKERDIVISDYRIFDFDGIPKIYAASLWIGDVFQYQGKTLEVVSSVCCLPCGVRCKVSFPGKQPEWITFSDPELLLNYEGKNDRNY